MLLPWTPRRRPSCVVVTGLRFEVACMYIADIYEYRLIAARLQVALLMGYWQVTMPFPSLRQRPRGIMSDVAGDADILIAPDLEARNMIAKQLIYLAGADAAGLVLGARVPVISASRADGLLSRLASSALAQLFIHYRQE